MAFKKRAREGAKGLALPGPFPELDSPVVGLRGGHPFQPVLDRTCGDLEYAPPRKRSRSDEGPYPLGSP